MISNKFIEDKANSKISSGNLSEIELAQLSSLSNSFKQSLISVNAIANLPSASLNTGRLIYVVAEGKYYFSNGETWSNIYSSVYFREDTAYAWGNNGSGQLGTGDYSNRLSPATVIGGITNWSQVSASGGHNLGVTSTGIAYAWGFNGYGQLGTGNTAGAPSPVTVIGGITNWSQVSAGGTHSLGLTSTGIAYAWGRNDKGQLGINQYSWQVDSVLSPIAVAGGITNWKQVSAGGAHSLGVTSTGILYAWGSNSHGQAAPGSYTSALASPTIVVGGITNWSQVSAGALHSLGVTSTGIAYAWGRGDTAQLGDGTTATRSSPVTVVGGITNWSQVAAGSYHSLGLTSTGIAYAWGRSNYGQLGTGNTTDTSSPVTVVGGSTSWSQVSAGWSHSLAIQTISRGF